MSTGRKCFHTFFPLLVIRECPIFFRPHSKAILSRAIHNDTEFLAQQMVMDYSLLVGIDEARSELVTGIIGEEQNCLCLPRVSK